MALILTLFTLLAFVPFAQAESDNQWGQDKKEAMAYLKKRKTAFDKYLADQQRRDENRYKDADQMKTIRDAYAKQLEKARKSYHRTNTTFPMKAYKVFIKERNAKDDKSEKARRHFSVLRKEMREVYENKEYRINGNKEFKL